MGAAFAERSRLAARCKLVIAMNKYSEEDKQRIIAQSREQIRRIDAVLDDRRECVDNSTSSLSAQGHDLYEPRVESRNERHRRELSERDQRWARERRREQREEHDIERRLMSAVDARIANLRKEMTEAVAMTGKAVEAISHEIDRLDDIVRAPMVAADAHVKQTLERIEQMIGDLGGRSARDTIDLPPLPLRPH